MPKGNGAPTEFDRDKHLSILTRTAWKKPWIFRSMSTVGHASKGLPMGHNCPFMIRCKNRDFAAYLSRNLSPRFGLRTIWLP